MTGSTIIKNLARRAGAFRLPPEGWAAPETLLYLAGAVLLVVGVLLGYLNWKPRYSSDEPIVVWKNDEPRLLRDAMRSGVLENLRISHSSRSAAPAQGDSVSCADLSEHWFKPITDPRNEWSAAAQGMPISCDWTPGSAEVVIINR